MNTNVPTFLGSSLGLDVGVNPLMSMHCVGGLSNISNFIAGFESEVCIEKTMLLRRLPGRKVLIAVINRVPLL